MTYTEQLERETERTRLELAATIDELRSRLTPGQVLDEVIDRASDTGVGEYMRNFRRQAIDHPLPLGLMGLSVAWLMVAGMFGSRTASPGTRDAADRGSDLAAATQEGAADMADRAGALRDRTSDVAGRVSDQAGSLAQQASDRAGAMAGQASAAAARAGESMRRAASSASAGFAAAGDAIADNAGYGAKAIGDAATQLGRNGSAAGRALADFGREQPLLVAAGGLVLGAIIGALLPSTQAEDRLIGESADAAKEKLRAVAEDQWDKAKDIASRTVEAAGDQAKEAASDFSEAAQHASQDESGERHEASAEPHEFGPGPGVHPAEGAAPHDHEAEEHGPVGAEQIRSDG